MPLNKLFYQFRGVLLLCALQIGEPSVFEIADDGRPVKFSAKINANMSNFLFHITILYAPEKYVIDC